MASSAHSSTPQANQLPVAASAPASSFPSAAQFRFQLQLPTQWLHTPPIAPPALPPDSSSSSNSSTARSVSSFSSSSSSSSSYLPWTLSAFHANEVFTSLSPQTPIEKADADTPAVAENSVVTSQTRPLSTG